MKQAITCVTTAKYLPQGENSMLFTADPSLATTHLYSGLLALGNASPPPSDDPLLWETAVVCVEEPALEDFWLTSSLKTSKSPSLWTGC